MRKDKVSRSDYSEGKERSAGAVDLTGQDRVEQSNAWMAALVESSNDAIISKNLNGTILSWNSGSERLFGYLADEIIGKPITLLLPPELQEEEEQILRRLSAGERIEHFKTVRLAKDGRRIEVSVTASPILDGKGRIIGASNIARDITGHKLAEEAQRRAKEEWERTFASVPDLIAILDNQHRVLRVNEAMARRLGLKPEQCIGLPCFEVIHGTSGPSGFCPHSRTLDDGCEHVEELHVDRFGGDFLVTTTPLLDEQGERIGSVHIAHDITERKKLGDALRESEQRVRLKLESILTPGGDIGNLNLADIIDARAIQSLMDDFFKLAQIPMALVDLEGNLLVGVGWQEICTRFHRKHPETSCYCLESDTLLTAGIPEGEFRLYKCKNNMWDIATPIMVGGKHIGNLFMGQFFFDDEQPDHELFRSQAARYGFNEADYIAAFAAVPRLNRESVETGMAYFMKLSAMISRLSYSNIKLARSLAERDALMDSLRKSLQQNVFLADIVRHAAQPFIQSYPDGRRGLVNNAYEQLTGYSYDELVSIDWVKALTPPEWREIEQEKIAEIHRTGKPVRYEKECVRKDGTRVPIELLVHLVTDSEGNPQYYYSFITDITERKQAEKALRKLNEELENRVAERTEELAATIDCLQLEIVERKKAEERVLRLNRLHAVLSETNQAIVRTNNRETLFNDFCRIAVEEGCFRLAWVGLSDDESGQLKIVAAAGATGYLEDIKIMSSENVAGCALTEISVREGTYCICNDFLGSAHTRHWHERGRAHGIRASASIALKQEERVVGVLNLYAGKKDFFDRQQIKLLRQMGADVSFALDNIIRETRRQEAEQALRDETIERLRAVEALREKEKMLILQSRQAAMGEMIGNIAHQWRQPLNALGLSVQQLLLFYDSGEFTRELLNYSVSCSMELIQHMSKTIDDFRNYFKPDNEKVEIKVCETIAHTLSLINDSFKRRHISIEVIAMDDPAIYGYRNEFAQVLLNILNNARDVLTERDTSDPKVTITTCSEGDRAVITVADNAGGIPEEIMHKIFDPYFTTKGPQAGTGVGLFMSKTIIEKNMGGKLAARNIAQGAEFRIEVQNGIQT